MACEIALTGPAAVTPRAILNVLPGATRYPRTGWRVLQMPVLRGLLGGHGTAPISTLPGTEPGMCRVRTTVRFTPGVILPRPFLVAPRRHPPGHAHHPPVC